MLIVGEPIGGIRKHLHAIIAGLPERDYRIFYVFSTINQDARFKKDITEIRRRKNVVAIEIEIKKKPYLGDLRNIAHLVRLTKAEGICLVHGHGAKGGAYARLVARFTRAKSIYSPHGGAVHRMFGPVEDAIYGAIERLLFRGTDYLLFESHYSATAYFNILRRPPQKYLVNHNGIAPPAPGSPAGDPAEAATCEGPANLGIFGTLRRQKGQEVMIRTLPLLRQDVTAREVVLHLFGGGPDRAALEQLARGLGVESRVRFYGDCDEVESHMRAMTIVVLPSVYESFGYVAVEAMALGKPVVAAEVGGLKEIVVPGVTGLLVASRDPREYARAIDSLLADKAKADRMGREGFARYQELFTERRMIDAIDRTYRSLMSSQ